MARMDYPREEYRLSGTVHGGGPILPKHRYFYRRRGGPDRWQLTPVYDAYKCT